jgi:PadR family transcriptional regulator PadR
MVDPSRSGEVYDGAVATDRKFLKELSAGITSLALLSILQNADEPMYGYQIAKFMEDEDENLPLIKHGVLYPVLRSLEKNDLLSSIVEPSVSGPPRRYYNITDEGKQTLQRWIGIWKRTSIMVNRIIGDVHDV